MSTKAFKEDKISQMKEKGILPENGMIITTVVARYKKHIATIKVAMCFLYY